MTRPNPRRPEWTSDEKFLLSEMLRERIHMLKRIIREQEALSKPVTPGFWRWADSGNDALERAVNQGRAAQRARSLRVELECLENLLQKVSQL